MRDGEKRVSNLQKIIFLLIIKTRGRTAMKIKKVISLLCTAAMLLAVPAGNVYAGAEDQSVVVTMPTTSEPESGFDPAYGWGAGEHVHEPLIQSTLVRTTKDLGIENDLAITDITIVYRYPVSIVKDTDVRNFVVLYLVRYWTFNI